MSKHPKIPGRLHVTSKRPEISRCLDVCLNVLKFQDTIFTFPLDVPKYMVADMVAVMVADTEVDMVADM